MHNRLTLTRSMNLALFAILFAVVPTDGAPIYYSRASTQVSLSISGGSDLNDTGQVLNTDTVAPVTASAAADGVSGYGTASVVDGTLHAFATGDGFGGIPGGAFARAEFFDTLVPLSPTLPDGTPVNFLLEQDLSYTLFGDGCTSTAQVLAQTILTGSIADVVQFQDSTCDTADFSQGTGIVQGFIGQDFGLQMLLFATANAYSSAFADAGNTFRLVITPIGDFTISSASGNTYQAAEVTVVPEPASLTLLGTSLIGLVVARRRRLRVPIPEDV